MLTKKLLLLGTAILLSGCGFKLAGQESDSPAPGQEELRSADSKSQKLDAALSVLATANPVRNDSIAASDWDLLGIRSALVTTDGSSSPTTRESTAEGESRISFSSVQDETCPVGMLCPALFRPQLVMTYKSRCQMVEFILNLESIQANETVASDVRLGNSPRYDLMSCNVSSEDTIFSSFVTVGYNTVATLRAKGDILFIDYGSTVVVLERAK